MEIQWSETAQWDGSPDKATRFIRSFHFIRFRWFTDDGLIYPMVNLNVDHEKLHVFTMQGSLIYPNFRELANSLMIDSSMTDWIKTRPLNKSPGSMSSMRWVQHQLQNCRESHEKCRKRRGLVLPMPTRLIAVKIPGNIDVHLEELDRGRTESYVALTYCWGSDQKSIMTTQANLLERLQNISFETFPQTIKDAIVVTRTLRYKYLWVDALCIVQDDEKDRAQEISKMSMIYTGASLTISAAKADDSKQGFLQERDLVRSYGTIFELPFQVNGDETGEARIFLHQNCVQNKREENIDKRGWTLQEHRLACRLLRYGSNQIEWNCQEQTSVDGGCQCQETDTFDDGFFKGLVEESHERYSAENLPTFESTCRHDWLTLVEDYSHRSLSKLSDKLPAFAVLAENFAKTMKLDASDYCARLWKSDIHKQLLWQRDTEQSSSPEKGSVTELYSETFCPSWSWASLRDSIKFNNKFNNKFDDPEHTLEIIECGIEPKTPGYRYGEVQSAHLTVRGYVRQVR